MFKRTSNIHATSVQKNNLNYKIHMGMLHDKLKHYFKLTNMEQYEWVCDQFASPAKASVMERSVKAREKYIAPRNLEKITLPPTNV